MVTAFDRYTRSYSVLTRLLQLNFLVAHSLLRRIPFSHQFLDVFSPPFFMPQIPFFLSPNLLFCSKSRRRLSLPHTRHAFSPSVFSKAEKMVPCLNLTSPQPPVVLGTWRAEGLEKSGSACPHPAWSVMQTQQGGTHGGVRQCVRLWRGNCTQDTCFLDQ